MASQPHQNLRFIVGLAIAGLLLTACEGESFKVDEAASAGGAGTTTKTVKVQWTASTASAVATTGGGYKVYVSKSSTITEANTTPTDVPVPATGTPPTSVNLKLASGKYYVSVQAYSADSKSSLSTPVALVVP